MSESSLTALNDDTILKKARIILVRSGDDGSLNITIAVGIFCFSIDKNGGDESVILITKPMPWFMGVNTEREIELRHDNSKERKVTWAFDQKIQIRKETNTQWQKIPKVQRQRGSKR